MKVKCPKNFLSSVLSIALLITLIIAFVGASEAKQKADLENIEDYDVNVRVASQMKTGESGKTLTYNATIADIGIKSDNYTVTVEDELGWSPSVSPAEISLENGENESVQVEVTVPSGLSEKKLDRITLKATGDSGAEDNVHTRAVNIIPKEKPPYPKAYLGKEGEPYYTFGVPTQRVEPPAVPIMTGVETGYSEDLTPREPWPILYGKGEFPPVAAAALVGNGRVITHSPAPFRDYYTYPSLVTRDYAPLMVRWLVKWDDPKDHKFLYYVSDPDEYSGVFNTAERVGSWLNDLDNELGFDVDIKEGGEITPGLLADYSVIQIAELKRSLTASEKQAVENWVESGRGLFLNCQADFQGYSAPRYPNALLEELGVPIRFQDDELYDEKNWVVDGPWFPQVYLLDPREENSQYNVWFHNHYPVTASLDPKVISVSGMPAVYELTVKNEGSKNSTLGIEVTEITKNPKGWSYGVEPNEIELSAGESAKVYVTIDVPQENQMVRTDWEVKVTDLNATYLSETEEFATLRNPSWIAPSENFEIGDSVTLENHGDGTVENFMFDGNELLYKVKLEGENIVYVPEDKLAAAGGGGIPLGTFAVVIVMIIVVVALGFWMSKR